MAFYNKWFKPNEKQIQDYLDKKGLDMQTVIRSMITSLNGQPIFFPDNTKNYVDQGYISNADVYSIIRQISRSCSVLDWKLYTVKNEKALKDYKRLKLSPDNQTNLFKRLDLRSKALEEVENEPGIMKFFDRPNMLQHWIEFYELSVTFRLITGNRYWVSVSPNMGNNAGKLQEAYVMPSQFTEIIAGRGFAQPISGYRVNFNPHVQFDADKVSHSKYPNPEYTTFGQNLYGMSPLRPGKKVLVKSNDGYTAATALLQSFGAIGMIVNKGSGKVDMDALDKAIKDKYSGPANRGRVMATNFDLDYKAIAMNAVDLALNEGQMLTLRQLCNVYNFPSELLNDKDSNKFNSHKESKKSAFVNAAIPELNLDRDDFNSEWFLGKYREADRKDYFIDYDITDVPEMQEDLEKLWKRLDNSWEITPNERRKMKGMDELPLPDMDVPWTPMGIMPMGERLSTDTTEFEEEIQKLLKI
jgi:phage portal protein BeeE